MQANQANPGQKPAGGSLFGGGGGGSMFGKYKFGETIKEEDEK
jgi:hypothetical protein